MQSDNWSFFNKSIAAILAAKYIFQPKIKDKKKLF